MKMKFENPIISIEIFDIENVVTSSTDYVDGLKDIDENRRIQVDFNEMTKKKINIVL